MIKNKASKGTFMLVIIIYRVANGVRSGIIYDPIVVAFSGGGDCKLWDSFTGAGLHARKKEVLEE